MLDTRPALADMAHQIRSCRSAEGLTLQQLASRCGVAASTIHKVESQQMVPTVSVLLKIAKGLERRPEELVRDEAFDGRTQLNPVPSRPAHVEMPNLRSESISRNDLEKPLEMKSYPTNTGGGEPIRPSGRTPRVQRIDLARSESLPTIFVAPTERAIVLVERGTVTLQSYGPRGLSGQQIQMNAGDCLEIESGHSIEGYGSGFCESGLTVIVTPATETDHGLGAPTSTYA